MNIAIQNLHLLPNLHEVGVHNYALDLVRQGSVKYLYFTETNWRNILYAIHYFRKNRFYGIDWRSVEIILSRKRLNAKCDMLLNFNTHTGSHDFTSGVRGFNGIKVWHVTDYFWNSPTSVINQRFERYGIDYILGYAAHDKYCTYFQKHFPRYLGKVIPVPFGYSPRFEQIVPFHLRKNKCVGLGSVNPLRILEYPIYNYKESADFFPDKCWMHEFRRKLVLNKKRLGDVLDSMFPEFPQIKDHGYDLVAKFNEYKMFVSCESIFNFPPAKAYEGPACGAVLVCADHGCYRDYGFRGGENCVMYLQDDIDDFVDKVRYYIGHSEQLARIQLAGMTYIRENFSHVALAQYLFKRLCALGKGDSCASSAGLTDWKSSQL